MRIAWIAESIDLDVASFRYRCLLPAWGLAERGHENGLFCKSVPHPEDYDVLIIVKNASSSALEAARRFHASGKPVFVDLCDNIFVQGYLSRINPSLSADTLSSLGHFVSGAVTSTLPLARLLRNRMPHLAPISVIPDGVLLADTFMKVKSWLPRAIVERQDQTRRTTKRHKFKSLARNLVPETLHHWVGLNGKSGVSGLWLNKNNLELPRDRAKIVWFGKHGTRHGGAGMMLLSPLLPLLEKVHQHRPIELVVVSNNWGKFTQLCEGRSIYARYERWSNRRTFQELENADLFLMPAANDPFSACKSANRAVMALSANVPVVASYLEDLESLRSAIVIDDWADGIDRYLFNSHARQHDLALARQIIDRTYSTEAISRAWENVLRPVPAELRLAIVEA